MASSESECDQDDNTAIFSARIKKAFVAVLTLLFFIVAGTMEIDEYRDMRHHGKLVVHQGNANEIDEGYSYKTKIVVGTDLANLDHPLPFFWLHLASHSFAITPVITLCPTLRGPPYS
jgi:hypothetical protein